METDDAVVACATVDSVVVDTGINRVVACAAVDFVGVVTSEDDIIASSAKDSAEALAHR